MHRELYNLIRAAMVILAILIFVILCMTDDSRIYPSHIEMSCLEPTTAPTEAPEPRETVMPTEITPAETEPPAAAEPPTEPEPTEPTYTEEELEMLALVIYQEAGGDACTDETRLMVGTVVMNRIADDRYPDTMYEVLTEERQYGRLHWTGIEWPKRASKPEEARAVERAYTIAERILTGERSFGEDVVFQSEYIMGEIVAYSDGMYFCR